MLIDTKIRAIGVFFTTKDLAADDLKKSSLRDFGLKIPIDMVQVLAIEKIWAKNGIFRAIDLCLKNMTTCLLCDEQETFFLPPSDMIEALERLYKNDICLAFANDDRIFRPGDLEAIKKLMAASKHADSDQRSRKIKKSLRAKKRRGWSPAPTNFEEREDNVSVAKHIAQLHSEGHSLQKICDILTHSDIDSPRGRKWYPTTVRRIIARLTASSKNVK